MFQFPYTKGHNGSTDHILPKCQYPDISETRATIMSLFCMSMCLKSCSHGWKYRHRLTHWGRVALICISKIIIIGSDDGFSPGRRQAIIYNNAGLLLIWRLGINLSEIVITIYTFSFKRMHFKMSFAKWQPFCYRSQCVEQYQPIRLIASG